MSKGILSGYTILDLSTVILGPFATQMLGDMGADVIKVEMPQGDIMRHAGPMTAEAMGPIYLTINRNKRSVVLDLKKQEARDILKKLVAKSDVLLHNIRAGGMKRLGFDYEAVREIRPDIVYVHAVGFGSGGPYAGRQAYDDLVQAASGVASMLPMQDGSEAPRYFPTLIADKTAGLYAANATLAALLHRERTGEGQFVEVPMMECVVAFNMAENLYGRAFVPPQGEPGYSRVLSPFRKPYATQDGYVAIMPYSDENWRDFFEIGGRPELASDKRFSTYAARTANISEVYRVAEEIAATKPTAEWMELLTRARVPVMRVHTLDSVLDDPQMRETGFVEERDHPAAGRYLAIHNPLGFSAMERKVTHEPPALGEHTGEVLRELGMTEGEIAAARDSGALG
jgi:crotonobetainyl-CoA:carnitine CoA-transferase CaiB-like acyl-CoA transferase